MAGRRGPLRNRCDPFGALHAVAARGLFTGNRGIIHDPETRMLLSKRWTTKAWIICALEHPRGRRRVPMGRNRPEGGTGWTELFFLDEVTALAAGHRPCFYCRRQAAKDYAQAFARSSGVAKSGVAEIDGRLHSQRLASGGIAVELSEGEVRSLPDGAMVAIEGKPFAMRHGALLPWSFGSYGAPPPRCRSLPGPAMLITPPASVAALRAGYRPQWHESAGS